MEGTEPDKKSISKSDADATRDLASLAPAPAQTPRKMSSGGEKSGSGGGGGGAVKTPSDFLKSIRGRPVVVKLNSGVDYRGEGLSPLYSLHR